MALLTPEDIQASLNIDLTTPNGQTLATKLIASAVAYVEQELGYPLEARTQTTYFDGEYPRMWLPTVAPVSDLTMAAYNHATGSYDAISSQFVRQSGNEVVLSVVARRGFQSLRATYTTGWTTATLPADLRQALIDLVGLKIQEVTNYSSDPDNPNGDGSAPATSLKRVTSGAYTEEYGSTGSEVMWKAKLSQLSRSIGEAVPMSIQKVVERYRVPFAL